MCTILKHILKKKVYNMNIWKLIGFRPQYAKNCFGKSEYQNINYEKLNCDAATDDTQDCMRKKCFRKSSTNSYFPQRVSHASWSSHASKYPTGCKNTIYIEEEREKRRPSPFSWTGPWGDFRARGSSCTVYPYPWLRDTCKRLLRCKRSYRIEFANYVLLSSKSS